MGKFIDRTGMRVGKLVVKEVAPKRGPIDQGARWWCLCDCGNRVAVRAKDLGRPGNTTSCGCHRVKVLGRGTSKRWAETTPIQRAALAAIRAAGGRLRVTCLPLHPSRKHDIARGLVGWGFAGISDGWIGLTPKGEQEAAAPGTFRRDVTIGTCPMTPVP